MKEIRIIDDIDDYRSGDCQRLVKIFADRNYSISLAEAGTLWQKHSDSMAAGWMMMPEKDEHVFDCVRFLFEEVEDE